MMVNDVRSEWFTFIEQYQTSVGFVVPHGEFRVAVDGSWHCKFDHDTNVTADHVRVRVHGVLVNDVSGPTWYVSLWLPTDVANWGATWVVFLDWEYNVLHYYDPWDAAVDGNWWDHYSIAVDRAGLDISSEPDGGDKWW